ncbi:MAG TPA: elongation factor P [Clostridiales bacterium]|nr:elongation factor P [Clostridiales bacterium]
MVLAGDLRKGVTIEYDGKVWTVVDFLHVKPGKGAAFVRTTLKNVVDGKVLQITFNPTEKFENAVIETKRMTYSYNDGELYYFMDEEYNMEPLNYEQVEDALKWIKENDPVVVKFYKGKAFSVDCENFVELLVTESEPGVAGNTATNAMKKAKLETGVEIQVPLFVNEGEVIRVDTRTGEYMERVKK